MQPKCVALIADILSSRQIQPARRARLQETLQLTLRTLNQRYAKTLISRFIVTTGDEFQALFSTAACLPDVLWDLESDLPVQIRIGIGLGTLTTKRQRDAIGMDGPVWHHARDAILDAKRNRKLGGVFSGFAPPHDTVLNGFARLLYDLRRRLTAIQRITLARLREDERRSDIARDLKLSKQAMYSRVKASRWEVYREGEAGWRAALEQFDFTAAWSSK